MYRLLIFGIALMMVTISCSKNKKNIIVDEEYPVLNAKLTDVVLDENTLFPTDLYLLSDTILVVNDSKNKDGFITFYDTNTQQPIAAFGKIGDGPNDFINPRFLHNKTTDHDLYVGDAKKIVQFSVDSIREMNYQGERVMSVPIEMMFYNYILMDNDSVIVFSQTGEHPISGLNKKKQELKFTDYYPDIQWDGGSEYIRNMEVFSNSMTSNSELIAIAYHNWNIISIVSLNGKPKNEIYLPEWDYNQQRMHIDPSTGNLILDSDAKIFFTKIKSSREHIFALGWSVTKEEIKNGDASSFIYVMDWEGNVKKKILFDRSVSNFCVYNETIPYVTALGDDGEIHVFKNELTTL